MLKYIRGKGQQPSAERQKLQRELFAFRKTVQHGFPNKPTSLAWDPVLRLLAIGTATGAIKVVGKPGVEFYGHHATSDHAVTKLLFIPNEGRLISLGSNNVITKWEINGTLLEEVKTNVLEGKLKRISAMCLESSGEYLLLGTEGGNVYLLNVATFDMSDTIIYQDLVMQNVPEDYKLNPGAVETMAEQPGSPDHVLIGYNRGLMVLWDRTTSAAVHTYMSGQQVESVCWEAGGSRFVSAHNDGSHAHWDASRAPDPAHEPTTQYGPFPCKAITKLIVTQAAQPPHEELILFAGGMPRASYSDRNTITALQGTKHVVFDFTSKVVDFFTIAACDDGKGCVALVVLAQEELVMIDLASDGWPVVPLPYLVSLHASAVTCSSYVSDVPQQLWDDIIAAGKLQSSHGLFSDAAWPIDGGELEVAEGAEGGRRDLLLTGHEDGSVKLWSAGGVALRPMYKMATATVLSGEEAAEDQSAGGEEEDDEWPPFRKVGAFDPYSDDPRLAVKKVSLCPLSGTLAVAGTAGHVIVAKFTLEPAVPPAELKVTTMNIVSERDGFVWKGHERLGVRPPSPSPPPPGFQPAALLQLYPPASVTALALHSQWGLVAAGTAHGLVLFDYARHSPVILRCTLNPNELSGVGDAPISRRKSFKKSLRESFRRLRKGRSSRHHIDKRGGVQSPPADVKRKDIRVAEVSSPSGPNSPTAETKPIERAVEARPIDDSLGGMVRCLTFARTYFLNSSYSFQRSGKLRSSMQRIQELGKFPIEESVQQQTPILWAGTNNGKVYVFIIAVPVASRRMEESVTCDQCKEIQLKHGAPVIGICIIDKDCRQVNTERGVRPEIRDPPPHRLIICSEEQLKIYALPLSRMKLSPLHKVKLTAGEGARVRRVGLATFRAGAQGGGGHTETCLLCLTNLGDTLVLSLPDLRRQINAAVIAREDINGISSVAFTRYGEAVYLRSSSELQRVTVSATRYTAPRCRLVLPPSARAHTAHTGSDDEDGSTTSVSSSSSSSSSDKGDREEEEEEAEGKLAVVRENGLADEEGSSHHDVTTTSSVGDITIDSVRDHVINTSTEESRIITTEVLKNETTTESVVVKTTVIKNETTVITPPTETTPALIADSRLLEEVRKAPLAKLEDLELEMAA